jgi:uncharacterized damage-inducible protein DinB
MTTSHDTVSAEVKVFRRLASMVDQVLATNLEGVTHEESLIQPTPPANCLNWVMGHLLNVYNMALVELGQEPVMDQKALARYARGAPPLEKPSDALDFTSLRAAWNEAVRRIDAALAGLTEETLNRPAPQGPPMQPGDTLREVIATLLFHQSYHVGQTGVLRRATGKPGAIK